MGYFLDYGPIILTVLAATAISILATNSNITIEQLVQSILLALALLATTQLIDRFRLLRSIDQKIDSILENSSTKAGIDQLFPDRKPSLPERLQQAKTVDDNGITLVGTSNKAIIVDIYSRNI